MPSDAAVPPPLVVPPSLNTVSRAEFRRAAMEHVDAALRAGALAVVVDLGETHVVDASVLGILLLLEMRAREHALPTRLLRAPEALRRLLAVTGLESRFELGGAGA
jgi:anti-anti-sigma regulatory factor